MPELIDRGTPSTHSAHRFVSCSNHAIDDGFITGKQRPGTIVSSDSAPVGRAATMATPTSIEFDITAAPRAVIRESARLLTRVLGAEVFGDARANVLQAMRADQERARERAEVTKLLDAARRSR
jgi:hypothetical protein